MERIVFSRFLVEVPNGILGDQFPVRIDMPLFSDRLVDQRVVMLQRSAEAGVFQHSPYRELMHSRCLLGPYREIPLYKKEIASVSLLLPLYPRKEDRAIASPRKNYLSLPR